MLKGKQGISEYGQCFTINDLLYFFAIKGLTVVYLFAGRERGDPVVLRQGGLFGPKGVESDRATVLWN